MIKKIPLFLQLFTLISFLFLTFSLVNMDTVSAVDPFPGCRDGSAGSASDSAVCQTPTDTDLLAGEDNLISTIANLVAAVGGIIAVVMVMYNGLQLIMSSGDSAKVTKARTGLIYTAVGIVVLVLARTIVYFIQSRL